MKRSVMLLPLLALLLVAPAWGQAKITIVGACSLQATDALMVLNEAKPAQSFELYVVCNSDDWTRVMVKNGLRPSETALTDWGNNRMWLGPKSFTDPLPLREVIAHELEHLRCHCDLGERNPHR